jgi:hypothetical protein
MMGTRVRRSMGSISRTAAAAVIVVARTKAAAARRWIRGVAPLLAHWNKGRARRRGRGKEAAMLVAAA